MIKLLTSTLQIEIVRKLIPTVVFVSIIGLFACSTSAENPAPPLAQAIEKSRAILRSALEKDLGPGLTIAVMHDGKLLWTEGFGFADLELGVKMKPEMRLRMGSVSKSLTAGAVGLLLESGKINLNESIHTYVPDFPDKGHVINVLQLGQHTSGIRHVDFANMQEANNFMPVANLSDALSYFKDDPLLFEPGTQFLYSSYSWNLVGVAIQNITGIPFVDYIEKNLFTQMGMNDTFADSTLKIIKNRSRFYTAFADSVMDGSMFDTRPGPEVINTIARDHSDCYPSCGFISTSADLAKFANTVFNTNFFSKSTRQVFLTPGKLSNGKETSRSFGFNIQKDENDQILWIGHGGETNGGYGHMAFYPETKLVIAALTNYNSLNGLSTDTNFHDAVKKKIPELFLNALRKMGELN